MKGGCPLSRQKLAARSSEVTPEPGIGLPLDEFGPFVPPSLRITPPIAAPINEPIPAREVAPQI